MMSQSPKATIDWDPHELVTAEDDPRMDVVVNVTRFGNIPQRLMEEKTAERCVICGHGPNEDLNKFNLGAKHVLGRLVDLLQTRGGVPKDEAEAIVAKLRAADVELP